MMLLFSPKTRREASVCVFVCVCVCVCGAGVVSSRDGKNQICLLGVKMEMSHK